METIITMLLVVLAIALIGSTVSTNAVTGVKNLFKITKEWMNIALTVVVDIFVTWYLCFDIVPRIEGLSFTVDIPTFILCVIFVFAGAQTIYTTIYDLQKLKNSESTDSSESTDNGETDDNSEATNTAAIQEVAQAVDYIMEK